MAAKKLQPKTHVKSLPSPYGGWNTRDSLDAMAAEDAVRLDNWIPGVGKVTLRNGHKPHSDASLSGFPVETLIEYHAGDVQKLIGAAGGKIIDYTTGTASDLATGFSLSRWQAVNFNSYLLMFNGTDAPQNFDGSVVGSTSWTGHPTPADLDGVMVHRNRIYAWDSTKQSFWYGGVNAVSGLLTEFPLSRVSQFGGNLIVAGSWTVDSGSGVDDYAVFVMSSGQAIIYRGSDPGDANNWSLVGVYSIGQPVNTRGIVSVGGDLLITTHDDYVSLRKVLQTGYIGGSSKLSGAVQESANSDSTRFGWQSVLHPAGGLLVFNVPQSNGTYQQHVINTLTGAPCRFTGIKSHCWATFGKSLYLGGDDGVVYEYAGSDDNGTHIVADAEQAWSDLGTPYRKRVAAMRPVLGVFGNVAYEIGIGFDFRPVNVSSPSTARSNAQPWDTFTWEEWEWGSSETIQSSWRVASGTGQTISPKLRVNAKTRMSWYRTDYRVERGNAL